LRSFIFLSFLRLSGSAPPPTSVPTKLMAALTRPAGFAVTAPLAASSLTPRPISSMIRRSSSAQ